MPSVVGLTRDSWGAKDVPMPSTTYRAASAKMGLRIKNARDSAGLSQAKLAVAIKTSRRNILRWEGGYNMPRGEHIAAIAEATGKSTDYFLGDDEEEEAALSRAVNDFAKALLTRVREVAQEERKVEA
jgi:transcriptional regulator with XRE-family HTH domain